MSAADVEAMRHAFDAFARGDLETALAFIDPSFEIQDRVVPEASPATRGPEALMSNVAMVREVFGDASWEPREIVDLDGRMLVRVRMKATGDHTSLPFDEEVGHLYEVNDGRATRLEIFRTWAEARRAAGLDE